MKKSYLVTGGSGFIGRALVHALIVAGHRVRSLDDDSRGSQALLADVAASVELVQGDIRDPSTVERAMKGMDAVCHLAFVNGTRFFYEKPELVLEVGVKGMMNVLDACLKHGVRELVLASSSEVYQTPPSVPTDESVPLSVPDPLNPRYSYGGGKIISELLALNYGRKHFDRVLVFRPHNVFGAAMGWEHVIPEFIVKALALRERLGPDAVLPFPIQGSGEETRSFVYIDDFTDGLMKVIEKGEHLGIYHIGTREEVSVRELAHAVAKAMGMKIEIVPGKAAPGATPRRCPDISKVSALGYRPKLTLADALPPVVEWYTRHPQPKGAPR